MISHIRRRSVFEGEESGANGVECRHEEGGGGSDEGRVFSEGGEEGDEEGDG